MDNNNPTNQVPAQPMQAPQPAAMPTQPVIPVSGETGSASAGQPMGTPPPAPKGKGPMVFLGVLIIASLVLLGGMFLISSQKPAAQPEPVQTVQKLPTMTPTPTVPKATDPAALSKEADSIKISSTDADFKTVDQELATQ